MEPRHEEPKKPAEPRQPSKKRRFQLIKLEERIAPDKGGGGHSQGALFCTGHICRACF